MKKWRWLKLLTLISLMIILAACQTKILKNKQKPLIITTIYPYELIVRQLVDTLFTVETLLPANASPHTWSPAPLDILKLQKADVIIANGLGLETNLEKTLANTGSKLIVASSLVDKNLLLSPETEHEHEAETASEHHHEGANPHIWTSPELLTEIVIGLTEELSKRFPMQKSALESNARLMIMELFQVDNKIKTERDSFKNPAIITLHDAFLYFFKYFHIDYVGSVQPSAGKDPAPQQLKDLADMIKVKHIKAIFIEPQMNPRPAEVLAHELKLKVIKYDDLGTLSQAGTISEFLWWNWKAFKEGF